VFVSFVISAVTSGFTSVVVAAAFEVGSISERFKQSTYVKHSLPQLVMHDCCCSFPSLLSSCTVAWQHRAAAQDDAHALYPDCVVSLSGLQMFAVSVGGH